MATEAQLAYWNRLRGKKHTIEHNNKISKSLTGKKLNHDSPLKGKTRPKDVGRKVSETKSKNKVTLKCVYCKTDFKVRKSYEKTKKFCSRLCYNNWIGKNPRPLPRSAWKKGNTPHNKGCPCTEEQKEKIRKTLKGKYVRELNPNWKGDRDIKSLVRASPEYKDWRLVVFNRDNFKCVSCNKIGGDLEAHHVFGFAKIFDIFDIKNMKDALDCVFLWNISNGVTLCIDCHAKIDIYRKTKKEQDGADSNAFVTVDD